MSVSSEYFRLRKKQKDEEVLEEMKKAMAKSVASPSSSFESEYLELREKRLADEAKKNVSESYEIAPVRPKASSKDIAPVKEEEKNKWYHGWLDSGAFEDGWDFGDVTKTILGTLNDVSENALEAVGVATENLIDSGAEIIGGIGGKFGNKEFEQDMYEWANGTELLNSKETAEKFNRIINWTNGWGIATNILLGNGTEESKLEDYSVLDDKSDSLVQSAADMIGAQALKAVPGVGVFLSPLAMFNNAYRAEMRNAYESGATLEEARTSAAISGGAEILFENIGGLKVFNKLGLDDVWKKALSKKVSNSVIRTVLAYLGDTASEGFEEVATDVVSRVGQKLTYMDEKTWKEMLASEEALNSYIDSAVGGVVMGFAGGGTKVFNSAVTGRDYVTDLTKNEEAVVNKVLENELAEAKKKGEKVNENELRDKIIKKLERGKIDIDVIEEVLGGDAYKAYKSALDGEEALKQEFAELGKKQGATLEEQARYNELSQQIKDLKNTSKLPQLQKKLNDTVFPKVNSDRLGESYLEIARQYEKFSDDVSKYKNEYARQSIQNIIDSGVTMNTREMHDVADLIASLSADQKVVFTTTDAKKLAESGLGRVNRTVELQADGSTTEFDLGTNGLDTEFKPVVKVGDAVVENYAVDFENGKITFDSAPTGEISVEFQKKGTVDGFVTKDGITINMSSKKVTETIVGHEITHVLKGTKFYDSLKKHISEYAKYKGEWDSRLKDAEKRYAGIKDADPEEEVVADLVGDYLFQDSDFVEHLTSDRNLFTRLYDEIKYLCKIATAGSEQEKKLLEVKRAFDRAYNSKGKVSGRTGVTFSVSEGGKAKNIEVVDGVAVATNVAEVLKSPEYAKPKDYMTSYSWSSTPAWEQNYLEKHNSASDLKVVKAVREFTDKMVQDDAVRGYVPMGEYRYSKMGPLRSNIEYIVSFDMDTSCPRTFQFLNYRNAIQRKAGRYLTYNESINLLELMRAYGQQIPCCYCYVENKRVLLSASYNNFFGFRNAVLNAETDAEAEKLMYGYDEKKGLPDSSRKPFERWRAERDYNPSLTEVWTATNTARNSVLNFLDAQKESGIINEKTAVSKLNRMVAEEFGITDKGAVAEIETFVNDWSYDTLAKIPHMYNIDNDTEVSSVDERALALNHEALAYSKSASSAKSVENYVPYTDQLKNISKEDRDYIMGMGGIRKHSSNDFRMDYVQDYFLFYADLAADGWTGHTYTKSADFTKIFACTNDRINMSIAFYEDSDGNLRENLDEGASWKDVQELRNAYKNVGAMAMVTSDNQLSFALNADWIDMIIPFHASGLDKAVWYDLRMWNDYTTKQSERFYNAETMRKKLTDAGVAIPKGAKSSDIKALFDETFKIKHIYGKNGEVLKPHFFPGDTYVNGQLVRGHHNDVETYFKLCDEYGVHPRFYGIQVSDANGNQIDVTEHPAYLKLIKETARTDSAQETIQFNFGNYDPFLKMTPFEFAMKRLQEEAKNGGFENTKADPYGVVNEFINEYLDKDRPLGYLTERAKETREILLEMNKETAKQQADIVEQEIKARSISDPDSVSGRYGERGASAQELLLKTPVEDVATAKVTQTEVVDAAPSVDNAIPEENTMDFGWAIEDPVPSKPISADKAKEVLSYIDKEIDVRKKERDSYKSESRKDAINRRINALEKQKAEAESVLADKPIKTVKERLEAKLQAVQTELANNKQLREESLSDYDAEIARLQAEYNAKKNKTTKVANDILRRIERLQRLKNSTDADYAKRISDLEARESKVSEEVRSGQSASEQGAMRKELHHSILENIKARFSEKGFDFDSVLKRAKNLSTFATVDNTPQRVMEKALGYKEGQILSDITVDQVARNESEGIKWLNSFTDRKNGVLAQLSKEYNIKSGSKESAAAQMYAEGFYVNKDNEIIEYGDAELAKDFPDANVRYRIIGLAGDPRIRQIYDDTLAMINESRARNAYPEIQKLDNYFLHFRAMDDTFSRLGLPFNPNDIRAKDLPTDLNGVTADLKPGQPYFASAMHRRGQRTSFDLLGGLEQYLTSAKNQIYHIDDIQTLRALRNYVADTFGQAKGLEDIDLLSEEEAQQRIEQVYKSHLSTFAKFLNEEANVIAGKTALIDRGLEGIIGRRGITFLDTINKQVGSNMVGFNVSSSLTNFLPVVQTFAKTNKAAFVKALAQTASNKVGSIFGKSDGFAENNPTIIRRNGAERFYRTPYQKMGDAGYALMGAVDNISTELIVRAKYNELTKKGMSEQQAISEADKWVSRLMGDRSLGQQPQLYNSKMLGLVTKFQLEVRNQLDSQFYDTIQEAKVSNEHIQNGLERNAKVAAKVTSTFVQLAVLQHLFGLAFESVAGYNPAFDIIEVLIKTFGWDDEEESEDTALDNIEQGFLALLEDLPYTSTFTGGRIPISSALPIKELVTGEDDYGNEVSRLDTLKDIAPYYVLPSGYGQLKKTMQGLSMFDDDLPVSGSYTDSGNLRFPVEDTLANRVQAGLFGQWASGNAGDYFDNERSPLKEAQVQEFIDSGLSIQEYWNYRKGLSGLKSLSEKADYIMSLDLPMKTKNLFINNLSDREDPIDLSDYDKYGNFEDFDFAQKYPEKYQYLKEKGISVSEYEAFGEETKAAHTWASKNPEKQSLVKAVTNDVVEYRKYTGELYDIRADKDENGDSIVGSAKEKKIDYINGLDLEYGQKIILFKSLYNADDTYNWDIIDYLNGRDDISYAEMETILKELGFTVSADGSISW